MLAEPAPSGVRGVVTSSAIEPPTSSSFPTVSLADASRAPCDMRRCSGGPASSPSSSGTILTAINHSDALLAGRWPANLAWKVPMTYAVPFIVATLGALGTGKIPNRL